MNVVSLFDGISVARYALDLAGIKVEKYYAAEIDKHAMAVSKKNYPNIVPLGSVLDVNRSKIAESIDLLIGGSPCQDLSIAKKGRKGLEGERSGLFWEYIRVRDELKPKYFILENVASMPQKDKDIISEAMGCQPILFNASLVSAQCRKRLFWTNIPFTLPADRNIVLKDILEPPAQVDERMVNKEKKAYTLTATYKGATEKNSVEKHQRTMVKVGHIGASDAQANRVYSDEGKSCCLSANGGGGGAKTGLYLIPDESVKRTMVKVGHIGEIKEGKDHANEQGGQAHRVYATNGVSPTLGTTPPNVIITAITKDPKDSKGLFLTEKDELAVVEGTKQGYAIVENHNSVDLSFANCKTTRRGRVGVRAKNLMTANNIYVNQDYNVRKLTPIECERLQSLPDNYTAGVAMTHRYKCLGNAFNAEVIAHILKSIKN